MGKVKIEDVVEMESGIVSMPDHRKTVHITSQAKGGVYKSGIAAIVAQYLQDHEGQRVTAFDTDPTNATLKQFAALNVTHVNVTNGNQIDLEKFHTVATALIEDVGPFVIDTGATVFLSFWHYVEQTGLIEFLRENDRRVVIHCPVMGGQELLETVKGFETICKMMPDESVVVWLNNFHGAIETTQLDGNGNTVSKPFSEFQVVQDNAAKILGVVRLGDGPTTMRGKALQSLSKRNMTFQEAMQDRTIPVMERHLYKQVQNGIYEQLGALAL